MKQNTIMAGGITHLTDARFFAAYAADYLGFCFDPQSPNYISPAQALAIKGWVTGPEIVAEFAHQDADNVREIIRFLEPSAVMVTAADWPQLHEVIAEAGLPAIVRFGEEEVPAPVQGNIACYLFTDTSEAPPGFAPGECMFTVTEAFDTMHVPPGTAIYISGSPEMETGIKSYDALGDWLEKMTG